MIKFNKSIYQKRAIENGIKAYGKLALFSLVESRESINVDIKKKQTKIPLDSLIDEFCNYVLSEIKNVP